MKVIFLLCFLLIITIKIENEMAQQVNEYDPNLLIYCSYCVNSFLDGTLNQTIENLTENLTESTTPPVATTESFYQQYSEDLEPELEEIDNST